MTSFIPTAWRPIPSPFDELEMATIGSDPTEPQDDTTHRWDLKDVKRITHAVQRDVAPEETEYKWVAEESDGCWLFIWGAHRDNGWLFGYLSGLRYLTETDANEVFEISTKAEQAAS